MLNLKDLLEKVGTNQVVDICVGYEDNFFKTPKTVFYGRAFVLKDGHKILPEDLWQKEVKKVNAYYDKIDDHTENMVIMIELEE